MSDGGSGLGGGGDGGSEGGGLGGGLGGGGEGGGGDLRTHEKSSEKGLCMAMPMGLCVKGLSMLSEFDCCENSRRTMVNLPTQPIKNTHISVSAIRNICDRGACGPTNERSFLQYTTVQLYPV